MSEERLDSDHADADEDLVERARNGDEAAFALLLERRTPVLRARIRAKLAPLVRRKVAESDVIQAAFLTAYQKLEKFEDRGEGSFRRWLDRIVERKIQEVHRHYHGTAKRGLDREVSQAARPLTGEHPAREPTPIAHAIAGELRARVRIARAGLPEHYREVLRLVQDEGFSLAEAGERMGRSAQAVAKLYGRALCSLTEAVLGDGRSQ